MRIGDLAEKAKVNIQTVRFYERRHLLPDPPRSESGHRQYSERELSQLLFIRQAKALGFSLEEIRQILRSRSRGECPCTDVIAMAEQHLAQVTKEIERLQDFQGELNSALRQWKRSRPRTISADAICTLIERTMANNQKQHKEKR